MSRKNSLKERMKRFLSGFLVFTILFGQTIHIPLLETSKAAESDFPNLVAIVVNDTSYRWDLVDKLKRYATDVQSALPGSRASIFTVPDDTTPEKIASMLERLYYEGDGNGISRLIGAVFVGEIPFPVVHREEKSFLSIFPYVDFVDKSFVYDATKGYYAFAKTSQGSDTPEIWHGIIRPNTGNSVTDRNKTLAFFDKTHDFYAKTGVFAPNTTRVEPFVFYFDPYHDQIASQLSEWKAYRLMLANVEDLAYRRYSKHLAKTVYTAYQEYLDNDVPDASGTEIGELLAAYTGSTLDFSTAPDIQTKEPIDKILKRFFGVLNEKYLGDILRYVHNAGRYHNGNDVRVDTPAFIVGKQDETVKRALKDANTAIENSIDAVVSKGLSKKIAVGTFISLGSSTSSGSTSGGGSSPVGSTSSRAYRNYVSGRQADSIEKPEDCSIVRGSSLPVEANRGYNVFNSESDANTLSADLPNGACFSGNEGKTLTFWWGNSPLNLDFSESVASKFQLKSHRYDTFIRPAFDLGGSREIVPGGELPLQTALDCIKKHPWISDPYILTDEFGNIIGGFPEERPGKPIACGSNVVGNSFTPETYETYLSWGFPSEPCTVHSLVLNGKTVKTQGGYCEDTYTGLDGVSGTSVTKIDKSYHFKTIPSIIQHKSPTDAEYGAIAQNFVTPSLPADRDRYVDFVNVKGEYTKIPYPNFYRITFTDDEDITTENAKTKIRSLLDTKSAELNGIIHAQKPFGSQGEKDKVRAGLDGSEKNTVNGITAKSDFSDWMKEVIKADIAARTAAVKWAVDVAGNGSYDTFVDSVNTAFAGKDSEAAAMVDSEAKRYANSVLPWISTQLEAKYFSKIDAAIAGNIAETSAERVKFSNTADSAVSKISTAFTAKDSALRTSINGAFTGTVSRNTALDASSVNPETAAAVASLRSAESSFLAVLSSARLTAIGKIDAAATDAKAEIALEKNFPDTEKIKFSAAVDSAVSTMKNALTERDDSIASDVSSARSSIESFSTSLSSILATEASGLSSAFAKWPLRCVATVCTGYSDAGLKTAFTTVVNTAKTSFDSLLATKRATITEKNAHLSTLVSSTNDAVNPSSVKAKVSSGFAVDTIFSPTRKKSYVSALLWGYADSLVSIDKNAPIPATGYDSIKAGDLPSSDIDLSKIISDAPGLLDTLAESVVWNNLNNATAKYAYVLEHHLDIDGNSPTPVAWHKGDYEISYLVGEGNATGMYVKLDPEAKGGPPSEIATILKNAAELDNALSAANIAGSSSTNGAKFRCGPPDGVPLWEWLPAIFCWLSSILPPTVVAGSCSPQSSEMTALIEKSYAKVDRNNNGIADYSEDANGNGIIDAGEYVKDGRIVLSANPKKASFRQTINLTAELQDREGKRVYVDSLNEAEFDIKRIVAFSWGTAKIMYSRGGSGSLGNTDTIRQYVNFSPVRVRAQNGLASFVFSTLGENSDVFFDATVAPKDKNGVAAFEKVSDELKLEIRKEGLSVGFSTGSGMTSTYLAAGAVDTAEFSISKTGGTGSIQPSFPIIGKIFDEDTNSIVGNPFVLNSNIFRYSWELLRKAGNYRAEFTDRDGTFGSRSFTITPGKAAKIELIPSSSLFVKNEKVTVLLRALDSYGNYAKGDIIEMEGQVSGGGYFVEGRGTTLKKTLVEGYLSFDVSANDGGAKVPVRVTIPGRNIGATIELQSLDFAKALVEVADSGKIIAGTGSHAVTIRVVGSNGQTLSGFSGVAALSFPKLSGTFSENFVRITDGVSSSGVTFNPGTLAGKNLPVEVRIPGTTESPGNLLTVWPDVPMRVAIETEKPSMEALPTENEILFAKIFDRYGNLAYNHASNRYSAKFSIPETYLKNLRFSSSGAVTTATGSNIVTSFTEGVAQTAIRATRLPGTPYVSVEVSPGLESHAFTVSDPDGKSVTIRGYSKNAQAIDTYYLWNASKIQKSQYNGLYTVLFGAAYGDFTQKNYLAWEILFHSGSRSMAVTTPINDATLRQRAFAITPAGKTELPSSSDSLVTAEIGSIQGKMAIDFHDPFYRETVARAYLNFSGDVSTVPCKADGKFGISNCEVPSGSAFALLKGSEKIPAISQNGLSLVSGGTKIFEFRNGGIFMLPSVRMEINSENSAGNVFMAKIFFDNTEVGTFAAKFRADSIIQAQQGTIGDTLAANPGKIVIEALSPRYFSLPTYLGNSSRGSQGIAFYSTRDTENTADREMMGGVSRTGLEEYRKKSGIGWEGGNKTLLEFAGGASVGEATRFNSSFSTANFGDPVVTARKLQWTTTYDRSIGIKIADSLGDPIESYRKFDFNGDSLDDLVVFFESGKVRLFANYSGTLKDLGLLAYVADADKRRKSTGDFAHDGFSDIIMVSRTGKIILLDNQQGKFRRKDAKILAENGSETRLNGRVVQLEVFDMDRDGFDDVVVSDESWELSILYGSVSGWETVFVRKLLESGLGLRLAKTSRSDGWAVYFDSLPQLSQNPTDADQERFLRESAQTAANVGTSKMPAEVQTALLNTRVYYIRSYDVPVTQTGEPIPKLLSTRLNAAVGNDPNDPFSPNTSISSQVMNSMSGAIARSASGSFNTSAVYSERRYKTYLRSEYSEDRGVVVQKTLSDRNGENLRTGDMVDITVTVTNSGKTRLRNVSFLDSFDKRLFSEADDLSFTLRTNNTTLTGSLELLSTDTFDYAFEPFDLAAGETATIRYGLKTNSVSFGTFFVGKLESDDLYGDVAMRASNVCSETATLWKSVKPYPRSYLKTTRPFPTNALGDGNGIAGKFIDSNKNGQPDYLDLISSAGTPDHAIGNSAYDASKHGLLLFRELPNPADGTLNSGNIEIARVVSDAKLGHLQTSAEIADPKSVVGIHPLAITATYNTATKTESAGVASEPATGSGLAECGTGGYSIVRAPVILGWKQQANAPKSNLEIFFSSGEHSKDGGETKESCKMTFTASSDPKWLAGRVSWLGWKVLTPSNYNEFVLAAKKSSVASTAASGNTSGSTGIPDNERDLGGRMFAYDPSTGKINLDGLTDGNVEAINATIDVLVQGLGCGFWGGACLAMPMNWAPLAPGTAPSIMGYPMGDLTPSTGLPIFSALNWQKIGKVCVPMPWPPATSIFCSPMSGAGGWLGDKGPTNFFRLYITPTLTGAMGAAACFGPIPAVSGRIPPPGVAPVVPGGNCVVAATPLLGCKDDGSDGDFASLGFTNPDGFLNANSCVPPSSKAPLTASEREMISRYVKGDRSSGLLDGLVNAYQKGTIPPLGNASSPLVGIGLQSGEDPNFEVGIDSDAIKNFELGSIVKIKNERTSAFPDFIMDWVNRQLEEVVNKLTSLPTLYVILPDFSRVADSGWNGFAEKLQANLQKGNDSYEDTTFDTGKAWLPDTAKNSANQFLSENSGTFNRVGRNASGIKAAYEFLSSLPLLKFETETVPVDIPMFSEEDIEKFSKDLENTRKQWTEEIWDKKETWSKLSTKDGVDEKILVQADATVRSMEDWGRFLDDAKRFPDKLYKYLTWKERYANQLLCNVEQIEKVTGGYISENGKRFRAWIELTILLKAILKSWQLMVDLFYDHTAECGVCRNERYDLKHFTFKIISAVIPKIPIIKFPKWPDIMLDLHNIRLGLRILMPEFHYKLNPIVLPVFPKLTLPSVPTLAFNLPMLPPPPAFPELPELPDIPSLPMITLPDLPPPPKIPKLFSAIEGVLKILKLVAKILCILRKNPFVPEWRAGDQIAQITERQWKSPLDFLTIEFPNFPATFLDAIKVTSLANLEFQVDFILEMAKATFEPVNQFTGNLRNVTGEVSHSIQGALPDTDFSKIGPTDTTIEVGAPGAPQWMRIPLKNGTQEAILQAFAYSLATSFRALLGYLESEKNSELTVEEFRSKIASEATRLALGTNISERSIAETLSRAVSYSGENEQRLIAQLESENSEKFRITKEAIREEIREVEIAKAAIARMMENPSETQGSDTAKILSVSKLPLKTAAFATTISEHSNDFSDRGEVLEKFEEISAKRLADIVTAPNVWEDDFARAGKNLLASVRTSTRETAQREEVSAEEEFARIAADTPALADASASTHQTGFSFQYSGIYVSDEGRKTRLFDYLEELDGTEDVVRIDTTESGTGKEDVVYRMGDGLYFKKSLKRSEPVVSNDSIKVLALEDVLEDAPKTPSAPNFFRENGVSSGEIGFSFSPANPADRRFRLEFFDYIDRFDRIARGETEIRPATPARAVDLFAEVNAASDIIGSLTGGIIRKNLAYFDSLNGEGNVTIERFTQFRNGSGFTLSAGSTAYAGASSVAIRFRMTEETSWRTATIPKYSHLKALAPIEVDVTDGRLFLPTGINSSSTLELSELEGFPILPGTKIEIFKPASRISIGYADGSTYSLKWPAEYGVENLGNLAKDYSVTLSASNDWYYSRLSVENGNEESTKASLTLLSPQKEADSEGPTIEFPSTYRIPVYLKDSVNLNRYIRDNSGVKDTFVDTDPSRDSDADGNPKNDRDSLASSSTGGFLSKGTELTIGPFETLWKRNIAMVAVDANDNITTKDIVVETFSPIPSILEATDLTASGKIDVNRANEPIDIFRFRAGKLSRLSLSGASISQESGDFSYPFQTGSNVELHRNGKLIANINEKTGKIELRDSSFTLVASAAKTNAPTSVRMIDTDGKEVYAQSFVLPLSLPLKGVTAWTEANEMGGFIKAGENSAFIRNSPDAKVLPNGGFLISSSNYQAYAGIGRDGNIYLLEPGYSLSYRNEGSYPVLVIKNTFNTIVAEILYRLDAEFIIR